MYSVDRGPRDECDSEVAPSSAPQERELEGRHFDGREHGDDDVLRVRRCLVTFSVVSGVKKPEWCWGRSRVVDSWDESAAE